MSDNTVEKILCKQHENTLPLKQPVTIACGICSQIANPNTHRSSDYADAQICGNCAANSQTCVICQEPLEDLY